MNKTKQIASYFRSWSQSQRSPDESSYSCSSFESVGICDGRFIERNAKPRKQRSGEFLITSFASVHNAYLSPSSYINVTFANLKGFNNNSSFLSWMNQQSNGSSNNNDNPQVILRFLLAQSTKISN